MFGFQIGPPPSGGSNHYPASEPATAVSPSLRVQSLQVYKPCMLTTSVADLLINQLKDGTAQLKTVSLSITPSTPSRTALRTVHHYRAATLNWQIPANETAADIPRRQEYARQDIGPGQSVQGRRRQTGSPQPTLVGNIPSRGEWPRPVFSSAVSRPRS